MTDARCTGCGAACDAADRFCRECGRKDPLGAPNGWIDPGLTVPSGAAAGGTAAAPTFAPGAWNDAGPTVPGPAPVGVPAPAPTLAPHSVFARRYRIERQLGEGGMGAVYLATDTSIHEPIALKVLSRAYQSDPAVLEQFKHELKLARKVRHRNVVASFHLAESGGYPYLTQEYIESDNLATFLEHSGRLDETEALKILRQVLRGLKAAHDLGIVHRDIKAGNILINKEGMAFITDFGLASSATQGGGLKGAGTPRYMAPELFEGAAATPASDLYACGILLFFMLTREYPLGGSAYDEARCAHRDATPRPIPDEIGATGAVQDVYRRLLAKDPPDRPQQALEVLEVVEGVLAFDALKVKTDRPIALVGDADELARSVASQALELQGYHVEVTATADGILNRAFSATPSLIVLASNVEGGQEIALLGDAPGRPDGQSLSEHRALGLCRLLQQDGRLKQVPLLVVVDHHRPGIESAFQLMGASEVIHKPITSDGFVQGITRARQNSLVKGEA